MRKIARWTGGSFLYGVATPQSDIDDRGIFVNQDLDTILGLRRFDQETKNNKTEDSQYYELRYFFELLSQGVLNAIEPLWVENLIECDHEFEIIRKHRLEFMDNDKIYAKLSGFFRSQELDTFNTEKKADADSNRGKNIAIYGYHPKAAYHSLRLSETGTHYFRTGQYRVAPLDNRATIMRMKTQPESFTAAEVREMLMVGKEALETSYKNHELQSRKFNFTLANEILGIIYAPIILNKVLKCLG